MHTPGVSAVNQSLLALIACIVVCEYGLRTGKSSFYIFVLVNMIYVRFHPDWEVDFKYLNPLNERPAHIDT